MRGTASDVADGVAPHAGEAPPAQPGATQPDPQPQTVADTGLAPPLLTALLARHLLVGGEQPLMVLTERLALHPQVVDEVVKLMLDTDLLHAHANGDGRIRIGLSAHGRSYAANALTRDGYVGPAPLSLGHYRRLVAANALAREPVTRERMHEAFADVVVSDSVLDQLGCAVNAGRPLLVHGPSGAGKTFLCQHLTRVLRGTTLIPHAIAIDDACVAIYDASLHDALESPETLADGRDPRLVICRRPALLAGAGLDDSMLDVDIDDRTGCAQAPLQLRANNGLLVVDDLGLHKLPVEDLIRRCVRPIEAGEGWLRIEGARSGSVPFDVLLVLVTNLDLERIGSDAMRHSVGHRIRVGGVTADAYLRLWQRACEALGLEFDRQLACYALDRLHEPRDVPPLAAHPVALLTHMLDQARYAGIAELSTDMLHDAWTARIEPAVGEPLQPPPASDRLAH